jgi:hypothetical protein
MNQLLVNLISISRIIGWRVFWLTMLQRAAPDLPPAVAVDAGLIAAPEAARVLIPVFVP